MTGFGKNTTSAAGAPEGTFGPHSSRVANAADPRVDSDADNRANPSSGLGGTSGLTGNTGNHGAIGSGLTGSTAGHTPGITGSTAGHTPGHTTGHTGGNASGGLSGLGHAAGQGIAHKAASAVGPAPNTAGPHKSDMMNKMDPRVDSDLDGSKTMGGNKTFSS